MINIPGRAKSYSSKSSSRDSTLSAEYLTEVVERLKRHKHRSTTRRTYHEAWCNFNDFLIRLDKWPNSWEDRIALFIADLMGEDGDGHPSTTIATYVSAIRDVLKSDGVEIEEHSVVLSSLLRACRVNNKSETSLRLPIRCTLLHMIIDEIENRFLDSTSQPFLCKLYKAILVSGYYGLLHIGEMTATESNHYVRYSDVHIAPEKEKILFLLRTSKTHNLSNSPQLIKISGLTSNSKPTLITKDKYCPYRIIHDFMQVRDRVRTRLSDPPLFIFRDGRPVKAQDFRCILKKAIRDLDLDETNYDTHSLRIGRAKDLQKEGLSVDEIKRGWALEVKCSL